MKIQRKENVGDQEKMFNYWNFILYVFLPIYALFWAFILYRVWWSKRGKIEVRVKTNMPEYSIWVKPEPDGKSVILRKSSDKKNDPGWIVKFDQTYDRKGWFFTHKVIDVFFDAPKAFHYNYETPDIDTPKLTKKDVKDFATWEALRRRYRTLGEKKTNWLNIGIFLICIFILILLLRSGGFIRI